MPIYMIFAPNQLIEPKDYIIQNIVESVRCFRKSWGKPCEIHGFWAMHANLAPAIPPFSVLLRWPVQFPKTPAAAAVVPDEVLGHMTHVPVVLS